MSVIVREALPEEPLAALRVLTDSEHELDRIRRGQVIAARSAGASWQQIGDAFTGPAKKLLERDREVLDRLAK